MNDIILVGAGIAGLSLAARLAPQARVTVLEAEQAPGYHASGRSAAVYEANYGLPSTVALNKASAVYFLDGGYLSPRGLMLVAGAGERDTFAKDCDVLDLKPMELEDARKLVPILNPDTVALTAYHSGAWDIDTDRLMQDHVRTLGRHGGKLVTRASVKAITRTGTDWNVATTDGQTHVANVLVNAAGAWADEIACMAGIEPIGITPMRRSVARIAAPGDHEPQHWPMLMGTGETWYAKPDAGALIVSPAEEDQSYPHDAWADDMVLAEGLARYEAMVTNPVSRPLATWAGLRSFSPDRALVLGKEPSDPTFVWCAGQGGYGFQTSPAASSLVAKLVMDVPESLPAELIAALSPARFR